MHTFKSTCVLYTSLLKIMLENSEGAIKNGQSRETGTLGSKYEYKQNKITTQYVLDTTRGKQTQITQIRHEFKIIH